MKWAGAAFYLCRNHSLVLPLALISELNLSKGTGEPLKELGRGMTRSEVGFRPL